MSGQGFMFIYLQVIFSFSMRSCDNHNRRIFIIIFILKTPTKLLCEMIFKTYGL